MLHMHWRKKEAAYPYDTEGSLDFQRSWSILDLKILNFLLDRNNLSGEQRMFYKFKLD